MILLFVLCGALRASAQIDPTLAGMVYLYTDKARDELKAQEKAMSLETTGHIWLREEVDGTTDIQKRFNTYLDSFRSIVCYAAQIYGFYHEVSSLTANLNDFADQLGNAPSNALAVALSSRRNAIYRELILGSVDIVNDIRQVCLSDTKMTEAERIQVVFAIRPKLKTINLKLRRLTRAVKYTSMADVWAEIEGGAREPADKRQIVQECMSRWKRSGRRGF